MTSSKILVWDLPTRAFHWLLALAFVGAFATSDSERLRDWHVLFGYTMAGLVAFRVVWGAIGTRYARFSSFAFGPKTVLAYLKSLLSVEPQHHLGHNPAGSWAIYALLALVLFAAGTGYAAYSNVGGHWMEELHEGIANALMAMVAVHLAGVLVSSLLHRENLARAMVTGYKVGERSRGIRRKHVIVATMILLTVSGLWIRYI
ncbi:MAG TPA: cytochrome b/b6 domain-containing protein [Burkholderiales bacterium]|nr:cytochrome b/b6 domain-containing protein [Burkholderiales bacterium]